MLKLIRDIQNRLARLYDPSEAKSIARLIVETKLNVTMVDVFSGKDIKISAEKQHELDSILSQIEQGNPVQYALGEAEFCGLTFKVNPSVLIPRPETEELVEWVVSEASSFQSPKILDIGTGSGCIATSIAHKIQNAKVSAWDISTEALTTAKLNAEDNNVNVDFSIHDALSTESYKEATFDIIVSNPPYIGNAEKAEMNSNVIDYEPSLALFVPDGDELRFYRAITEGALNLLTRGGLLFFEINSNYGEATANLVRKAGFSSVELRQDFTGRDRMIKACL